MYRAPSPYAGCGYAPVIDPKYPGSEGLSLAPRECRLMRGRRRSKQGFMAELTIWPRTGKEKLVRLGPAQILRAATKRIAAPKARSRNQLSSARGPSSAR